MELWDYNQMFKYVYDLVKFLFINMMLLLPQISYKLTMPPQTAQNWKIDYMRMILVQRRGMHSFTQKVTLDSSAQQP